MNKYTNRAPFAIVLALAAGAALILLAGCQTTADAGASPGESIEPPSADAGASSPSESNEPPSATSPAPLSPDVAGEGDAAPVKPQPAAPATEPTAAAAKDDPPETVNLLDAMDEKTRILYEEMEPGFQYFVEDAWETIRKYTAAEEWEDAIAAILPQIYDSARQQDGLRVELGDEPRWCRDYYGKGTREPFGEVHVTNVLSEEIREQFYQLSWSGMEASSIVFDSTRQYQPCVEWRWIAEKYVNYFYTAEQGEWTQAGPRREGDWVMKEWRKPYP